MKKTFIIGGVILAGLGAWVLYRRYQTQKAGTIAAQAVAKAAS